MAVIVTTLTREGWFDNMAFGSRSFRQRAIGFGRQIGAKPEISQATPQAVRRFPRMALAQPGHGQCAGGQIGADNDLHLSRRRSTPPELDEHSLGVGMCVSR